MPEPTKVKLTSEQTPAEIARERANAANLGLEEAKNPLSLDALVVKGGESFQATAPSVIEGGGEPAMVSPETKKAITGFVESGQVIDNGVLTGSKGKADAFFAELTHGDFSGPDAGTNARDALDRLLGTL